MTAHIVRGDARALPLPDASVDLIVTSPPYFALRSYTDGGQHYDGQIGSEATPAEYIAALIACTREWARVLKPSGSIFVNLGDKYSGAQAQSIGPRGENRAGDSARTWRQTDPRRTGIPNKSLMLLPERYRIACVDELSLIARAVLVWSKPNGLPESVTDRVRRSHEDWVHLTKQTRYYANLDGLREEPRRWDPPRPLGTRNKTPRHTVAADYTGWKDHMVSNNPLGKIPGSVWEVCTEPLRPVPGIDVQHFAAFPSEWPRRLILGWSPPDGTILDPFGGTGTTAHVADALGRTGISVDASGDYCRLAAAPELADARRRKVLGFDKAEPIVPGQLDLLALGDPA